MDALIACEESQTVTIALRSKGINAYSCDILPCSGGHPEWHLQQDVLPLLKRKWDIIIAFPPCTDLAVSGAKWFEQKRKDGRQQKSIAFFLAFTQTDCQKVAIENPVGVMSRFYRKPDQIVQPYEFGHTEMKKTCFWLNGLPKLIPTNNVFDEMMKLPKNIRERNHYMPPTTDRSVLRSKTYQGIAQAMAEQWGNLLLQY